MRVAALQFFPTPFALAHNLDTAEQLVRQAAAQGARLLVLPAFFNTGYVYAPRWRAAAEAPAGPTTHWLQRLSTELDALIGGTWLMQIGAKIFNAFGLASPDGTLHTYHQQQPFLWEHCYFSSGREPWVAETPLGRIGLLANWDVAHPKLLEAYQSRVDVLLMSSALPRLHRAVLNFPLGQKVYLAQLTPSLVSYREALDDWYARGLAAVAAHIGAPVAHAAAAGRFVTELPRPQLSIGLLALTQPRYWSFIRAAHTASLRATFSGASAIVSAQGEVLAQVETETGLALADLAPGPPTRRPASPPAPPLPFQWHLLNRVLKY